MRIDHEPKLDFDDVLIRPKRSEAPSRSSIVLEREHRFLNSGATWKGVPIVASNMDTVGTMAMARTLGPEMMTCLHKHYSVPSLIEFFDGGPVGEPVFLGNGLPSVVQCEVATHDLVGSMADQHGMPAGDLRDYRSVARLVCFGNSVRLPVKLITNRKTAHGVREQIMMKSVNFPDLIADVNGFCCSAHLALP